MNNNKKTIILLNLPLSSTYSYKHKGTFYPTTAIVLIGTLLQDNGYNVKIIDGCFHENYLTLLEDCISTGKDEILYIGLSVMTPQISPALQVARLVKSMAPDLPIVIGGPHPTMFPEQTIQDENIDIISINEGAVTALKIADTLRHGDNLETVPGIIYKDDKNIARRTQPAPLEDIASLPHLDFSLIEIEQYLSSSNSVFKREFPGFDGPIHLAPILTGLGCPYKCQFCINVILKRRYRMRLAESIIDEIKNLQKQFSINTFQFMDEDFFINKNRALQFLDLVEQEGLHFNWRMWCRVDHFKETFINREMLRRLERIGHGSMVMGGESGNQEILNNLHKGITTDQILHSLRILKGFNITPRYSFMVGLEDESLEQIRNTYKFCFKMRSINAEVDIAGPFVFRLYPGSPIFNRLVEKYKIPIPTSLQAWEKNLLNDDYLKMPWTPESFQKSSKFLEFYAGQALHKPIAGQNILKAMAQQLLTTLSRFRLRLFFFQLPIEYWLAQKLKSLKKDNS